jgi:regulator of nucleoside diphosphate kinase
MTELTTVATSKTARSKAEARVLPPIVLLAHDIERLRRLADAAANTFPRTADFLAREVERASILDSDGGPANLVTMGSTVEFRDDSTGRTRWVTLVYPPDADVSAGKISVLTPVGAALIGLSAGQSIEYQAPSGEWRSLTVLAVRTKNQCGNAARLLP